MIVKLGEKLCSKINTILSKSTSTVEYVDVMESKVSLNKKMLKVQRVICEYCDKLCDLNNTGGGTEAMGELKEYLKVFIKEKENMYKIKIQNKLYGGSANKRVSSSGNKKRKRD